jgi:hypothetical protein
MEINKFNMATRSYKSKKKIKNRHSYSRKWKCCASQEKMLNVVCMDNEVKKEYVIEECHHSHSTWEHDEDFTYALLGKTATTIDFSINQ